MKRKKIRALALVVMIAVIGVVLWCIIGPNPSDESSDILTSGFIEAREVIVAVETGGRIADITASEGIHVTAGKVLVKLDDSLLKAQKQQAEANVRLAQAYLEQALVSQEGTQQAWRNAVDVQLNPLELEAKIIAAQGELDTTQLNLLRETEIKGDWVIPSAEIRLDTAKKALENYRKAELFIGMGSSYDRKAKTIPAEGELSLAELNLSYQKELEEYWTIPAAELRRDTAQKALDNLLAIRENPQEINALVDQTHSANQIAMATVKAVERQVEQAEASLAVVNTQLDKLSVSSPISGVVSAQHAEVGEIAQPGAPILTIINLEEVTLTAYVPESKIGLVKLGQEVAVSVDSYPGENFPGEVVYISPRAIFTPKNVQLKEEREKMVFSVKVELANSEQKLKPGMPADAMIIVD